MFNSYDFGTSFLLIFLKAGKLKTDCQERKKIFLRQISTKNAKQRLQGKISIFLSQEWIL